MANIRVDQENLLAENAGAFSVKQQQSSVAPTPVADKKRKGLSAKISVNTPRPKTLHEKPFIHQIKTSASKPLRNIADDSAAMPAPKPVKSKQPKIKEVINQEKEERKVKFEEPKIESMPPSVASKEEETLYPEIEKMFIADPDDFADSYDSVMNKVFTIEEEKVKAMIADENEQLFECKKYEASDFDDVF